MGLGAGHRALLQVLIQAFVGAYTVGQHVVGQRGAGREVGVVGADGWKPRRVVARKQQQIQRVRHKALVDPVAVIVALHRGELVVQLHRNPPRVHPVVEEGVAEGAERPPLREVNRPVRAHVPEIVVVVPRVGRVVAVNVRTVFARADPPVVVRAVDTVLPRAVVRQTIPANPGHGVIDDDCVVLLGLGHPVVGRLLFLQQNRDRALHRLFGGALGLGSLDGLAHGHSLGGHRGQHQQDHRENKRNEHQYREKHEASLLPAQHHVVTFATHIVRTLRP